MNPIYQLLLEAAEKHGAVVVREACRRFLKEGVRAGVIPTPRKRIPRSWVLEALDRQGGLCKIGGEPLHVSDAVGDHALALVLGGRHNKWNIVAACGSHNSQKGGRSPMEQSKRSGRTLTEIL